MKAKDIFFAILAIGVVANLFDYILHEQILVGVYATIPSMEGGTDPAKIPWIVLIDIVYAIEFLWFYGIVRSSFEKKSNGALRYGACFGILVCFPTFMLYSLIFKGYPYWLSWVWVSKTIIQFSICGLILGAFTKKMSSSANA